MSTTSQQSLHVYTISVLRLLVREERNFMYDAYFRKLILWHFKKNNTAAICVQELISTEARTVKEETELL